MHGVRRGMWTAVIAATTLAVPLGVAAQTEPGGRVLIAGGEPDPKDALPPEPPWSGGSRALLLPPGDAWATLFEKSGGSRTPGYEETVAWLRRLDEASPDVELVSLGRTPEGRDLWMVVAASGGVRDPKALHALGKPVMMAQAGIHAGEIDGKDAGMMLLRDLTVKGTKRDLLSRASFLFIPILNVDGHERFSRYGRINQRGPEECGWRTTAMNLNLNRDYAKLDAPEMRLLVTAIGVWDPDLYLDLHVTDGIDHQYDVTWSYNGPHAWSPNTAAWLDAVLSPRLTRDLEAQGHVPGPYVEPLDRSDPARGVRFGTADPRYSNGYADARHIAGVLLETHSLKSYPRRVLGTYVFLESALRTLGDHGRELGQARGADAKLRRRDLVLDFTDAAPEPEAVEYKAVESTLSLSAVSGGLRRTWTGVPVSLRVTRVVESSPKATVSRPRAYWIPPAWSDVALRLEFHGIRVERLEEAKEIPVTLYRIEKPVLDTKPYEGRVRVSGNPVPEERTQIYPAGSVRVSTDQPLGDLAMLLLEPGSPDSFFQWGFFLSVLQNSEYSEESVMEGYAEAMLAASPTLAAQFREKLAQDPEFARDPQARLDWFYRKTPYADDRWRQYPVGREE